MTRRLLMLVALALLAGCGPSYTLRVRNDYSFPVEVIQRSAGGRLSRQDDPLGTVPAGSEKDATAGHPYLSGNGYLALEDQQGRTLREIRAAGAPGFSTQTNGRKTTATLHIGPESGG
jgi:hypothetical protein